MFSKSIMKCVAEMPFFIFKRNENAEKKDQIMLFEHF